MQRQGAWVPIWRSDTFLFPKEHDRWLSWVQACGRLDLIPKGPEYAHRNCRLCHIHFEEKDYKTKGRARLNPDTIPRFFKPNCDNNSAVSSSIATDSNEDNTSEQEVLIIAMLWTMKKNFSHQ